MKKIAYIFSIALAAIAVSSCDWFELDNQDSYNAKIHGSFVDYQTGEPVPQELYGETVTYTWGSYSWTSTGQVTGYVKIYEYGWDAEAQQTWNVKNNGTYTNNLVFAGDYRIESNDANYETLKEDFTIKKGDNEVNFTVKPYARVLDPKISYDSSSKKIIATFKIEPGYDDVNYFPEVRLCCSQTRFVGTKFNNCKTDPGAYKSDVTALADGTQVITLQIDTQAECNIEEFKYTQPHYVRIAVCAGPAKAGYVFDWSTWSYKLGYTLTANTNKRYNFSPVYKISEDWSEITEVTNWDEQ